MWKNKHYKTRRQCNLKTNTGLFTRQCILTGCMHAYCDHRDLSVRVESAI